MFKLVVNPKTGEVLMYIPVKLLAYGFDGKPWFVETVEGWRVVGEVPNLFDWQRAPAEYGPSFAAAKVLPRGDHSMIDKISGTVAEILAWCEEHNPIALTWVGLYATRKAAGTEANSSEPIDW